ncbi:D-arabinono-1,4-lactone oxidase [Actinoallomurus acaciae]|uniref:D-arabinono-1,4-lactone oxidase n=1 Tax=Actinoallomurus acaciae TaxID=502577 RepID=A0ABV5YBA8_9ACTN
MPDVAEAAWRNWAGNQSFHCRRIVRARGVEDVVAAVGEEAARGGAVRAAGAGHSFTPVVQTDGTLLDISAMSGVVEVDGSRSRARVRAGTRLADIGAPLWEQGWAIANQGDIDRQTLAGAVSTGTKGSGTRFGTMSSTITAAEVVTGTAEVVQVDETDLDALHATQVSLGLLGVITELELAVVPRYFLREKNLIMHVDELLERWDDLKAAHRHFSFWWMPRETSAKVYELPDTPADHAFVKLLQEEEAAPEVTVEGPPGARLGRAHLIYPDIDLGEPFYELEYVLAAADDKDAFLEVRELMRSAHPDQASPVQARWQQADRAMLSPQYRRDSVSISVSGIPGTDWEPFLTSVDRLLGARRARPHWGKVHFLTPQQVIDLYPRLPDFDTRRRKHDPMGLFLNAQFTELLSRP